MSRPTRRQAIGVATGAAASIALVGTAATSPGAASAAPGKTEAPAPGPAPFDEVFQGRRIEGAPAAADAHAHGQAHAQGHAGNDAVYRVWIDGRELHVMQHGSSGWSSAINHYERFATPLDTARTAVASLKGAHVVPFDHTA
ncbi:tyrosinase [Streptomyces californicus]|uniref:Tyrosinase n=1 Tax=Streptomyces californicus TaxID=67351 RepID=A0ABD7CTY6_9ACTN|nr:MULTISPECIES: tyrosinase family oxidase copper chaperone [Streptomyces]QRV29718.1 tyrosinase [Streptomyces californicus]QRV34674.1 tyrosinase [Streptomyces californicus]QRV43133.1 tyrosinase [Streptomyces californicus]QRV49820.1 tyrosinase [Streptomyces californicus]